MLTQCTALDFALQQCPPNAQVGYTVIHADYDGDPNYLMGLAPIYTLEAGPDEAARFAFIVPILNIPIAIPVTVRSATDYGLRFTVSGITQAVPLSEADLTFWGFPAEATTRAHDLERFAKGSPGEPAGCLEEADQRVLYIISRTLLPDQASVANRPFTGNPSVCAQSD